MKFVATLFIAGFVALAQDAAPQANTSIDFLERDLRASLVNSIDVGKQSIGIVAGVLTPQVRRFVVHGLAGKRGDLPLNANTVFEIGSITKVFTSLLLADMVQRGEVKLEDPISRYLPPSVSVPSRNGRFSRRSRPVATFRTPATTCA